LFPEITVADLKDLVLLRNDPGVTMDFLESAHAGDVDAQYGLGLIYAEGRGISQDNVKAFYWLTKAYEQGDTNADLLRQHVAAGMTPGEFDEVDALLEKRKTSNQD
jgi:TPR repeat protein